MSEVHPMKMAASAVLGAAPGQPTSSQATPARRFQSTLAEELICRTTNRDAIVTNAPSEHYRLGFLDVSCLIINRMIGKDASRPSLLFSCDWPRY
jgi:hypothetical protein